MSNEISHPAQLTRELHSTILTRFRESLENLKKQDSEDAKKVVDLRIRDWWLARNSEGIVVEVYIDKGPENPMVDLDECFAVHRWFLEGAGAFDAFDDSVSIEVGSPGGEPTLRDLADFQLAVGEVISVETWEKVENRSKYVMLLEQIATTEGEQPSIILAEGPHRFPIPLSHVKKALLLPHHRAKVRPGGKPQKGGKGKGKAHQGKKG